MNIYDEWALERQSLSHPLYEKISDVNLMAYVHLDNFHILQNELNKHNTVDRVLMSLYDRRDFKKSHLRVTNVFFNYISSAIALRDATRNMLKVKDIDLDGLKELSTRKIQESISSNPVVKLVEDLRNIITHQSMLSPSISSYINIKRNENMHGYAYSISKLIKNERLTAGTRKYLSECFDKFLFILPLVETYHSITSEYQFWLLKSIDATHRKLHPEYWRVRNEVMSDWGGDEPIISKENINPYLTL